MGAEDLAGKVAAILFPTMAFVAVGADHVVAKMFLPAARSAGARQLASCDAVHNWMSAFPGSVVGAAPLVAAAYRYLCARGIQERAGRHAGRRAGAGSRRRGERGAEDRGTVPAGR